VHVASFSRGMLLDEIHVFWDRLICPGVPNRKSRQNNESVSFEKGNVSSWHPLNIFRLPSTRCDSFESNFRKGPREVLIVFIMCITAKRFIL
jgi:hypothetical protein